MGVGTHVLVEFYDCPTEKLCRVHAVRELMMRIIEEAGLSSVGEKFHQFEPAGVTGIVLLSESHFSIHTWPEKHVMAADIFCCSGRQAAFRGFDLLKKHFQPRKVRKRIIER
jgi:S-adenosylmethionine decarboxylase proenzyme